MNFPWFATLVVAATLMAMPGIALAADNKLVLVMAGEAYDGPPKFSVTYDGKPLGEGVVNSAIDTGTAGRFADAADKKPYVQSFDFTIPPVAFRPNAEIAVKFINEASGGPGSNHDRNIYLQSVAVNGDVIPAPELSTRSSSGTAPNTMVGDYLMLKDGTTDAIAKAPAGGWPAAATAEAAAKPADAPANAPPPPAAAPAAATVAPAKVELAQAETAKPDAPQPATPAPAPQAQPAVPAPAAPPAPAAAPAPAPAAQAPAALNDQTAAPGCTLDKSFAIVGFNENSNELTPKLNKQLDGVVKEIGAQRCAVRLTGYSSTEGSLASNALFSVERAQNALKYLRDKGVKFAKWQATGVGETKQFGASAAQNRRVVIAVTPGP
ncbi:MAG: hypothetical protein JWN11_944 [Hyphomicrobiales bacterium]|nr:hypothetical protein [Hyphomicrobiales bacterium]